MAYAETHRKRERAEWKSKINELNKNNFKQWQAIILMLLCWIVA